MDDVTAVTVDVDEPTVTVEPADTPEVELTVRIVEVLATLANVVKTSPTVMYVGLREGATVGATVGTVEGCGVGRPAT